MLHELSVFKQIDPLKFKCALLVAPHPLYMKVKFLMKYCLAKLPLILIFKSFGICYAHNQPRQKDKFGLSLQEKGVASRLYNLDAKEYFKSHDVMFCENEFSLLTNTYETQDDSNPSTQVLWNDGPRFIDASRMGMHNKRDSRNIGESVEVHKIQSSEDLMNENLGRGHRECHPPSKLKDYICHTVNCVKDLTPKLHPPSQSSSIHNPQVYLLYPITNYVTCTNFSMSHRQFLTTITSEHESSRFFEAIRDPLWKNVMKKEIDALERNET
ncbi:hypothetical protein CR513_13821, partial [Mucuna pruriens]